MSEDRNSDTGRGVPVRRLRVRRQKGRWDVVADRRIKAMILPVHHPRPKTLTAATWIEVLDEDDDLIYRRRVSLPGWYRTVIAS